MSNKILIPLTLEELNKLSKNQLNKNDCFIISSPSLENDIRDILKQKIGLEDNNLIIGLDVINGEEVDILKDYKSISSFLSIKSNTYLVEAIVRDNEVCSIDYFKLLSIQREYMEADKCKDIEILPILYNDLIELFEAKQYVTSLALVNSIRIKDIKRVLKINEEWDGESDIKVLSIDTLMSSKFFS